MNLTPGKWTAEVIAAGQVRSSASLDVTYGGPSPLYLSVAGSLIFGFLLLGFTNRYVLPRKVSSR